MYKVNTLMCTGKGAKRFYQGDKVPAISFENGAAAAMLKAGQLTDISVKQEVKVLSVAALSVKIKEAKTIEEVKNLVGEDKRTGVINVATKKIEELSNEEDAESEEEEEEEESEK